MRKLKILVVTLLAFSALASLTTSHSGFFRTDAVYATPAAKSRTYPQLWKTADSLASLGLTREVLKVVSVIYTKAKTENNAPHLVKAVIYRLKFESYITDDDYVKAIADLTHEASVARHPVKPLMHSVLAEIYWRYYQQNRYRFLNRTVTVNFVPDDIRTWDLRKIAAKVIENYRISLENADSSKRIALDLYDEVLTTHNDSKKYRPTLYDFLAHRALDFFSNTESGLTQPADRFQLNDPVYFSDYENFAATSINSPDPYALKYYAVLIFQDLLRFHAADANPEALIDLELKRLQFMRRNVVVENADSLYLNVLERLEKRYLSHPASTRITYEIASFWLSAGTRYAPLVSDDNKWMNKKAYGIAQRGIDRYPQSMGAANCRVLQQGISAKNMTFTIEESVAPREAFRMLFSYKNMDKVHLRICKVDPQWLRRMQRKYYGNDLMQQYTKLSPVKEFTQALPDDGDYQLHSVEIPLPGLEAGYYLVLAASSPSFTLEQQAVATSPVWVTNLCYLKRTDDHNNTYFTVMNRTDGRPVKNAGVQLFREKYNYTTREYDYTKETVYTTDEDGLICVPPRKDYNYSYYYAEISAGGDVLQTDPFYQYYDYDRTVKTFTKTIFFTDRSIYRPGQTVHFKGLVLDITGENSVIKPNFQTTVVFYDVNSQKVAEQTLTSNEFGTFSGTFTAPAGTLTGQMYLGDGYGYVYFSVEEYKRPKFEVRFDPVKGSYKLGEMVKLTGNAKAYAGSDIDHARVSYRVVRSANFPYWWYYRYGYFPQSPQLEVENGVTETDARGSFTIDFKALEDQSVNRKMMPVYTYVVYADVTDLNGETRSAQTSVRASTTALEISVDMPETIEQGNAGNFDIQTTNLSGQREHAKGRIEIYRLKGPERLLRSRPWSRPDRMLLSRDEFQKLFPRDVYQNETDVAQFPKEASVVQVDFDTQRDSLLHLKDLKSWPAGHYMLEMQSKDIYGTPVSFVRYFVVFSQTSTTAPVPAVDWFSVLKRKGEPGEQASFLIATMDTVNVRYEIEHNGKIVQRQWMPLTAGQHRVDVPITEAYRGNFAVHFTFVRHGRVYQHDVMVEVPYTNKELDVEVETYRNKLLPGEADEWRIKIRSRDGQKVTAELLAGMYDASLDAFRTHQWPLSLYNYRYARLSWERTACFGVQPSQLHQNKWNPVSYLQIPYYDALNWFGFYDYYYSAYYEDYDGRGIREEGWAEMAADEVTLTTAMPVAAQRETSKKDGDVSDATGRATGGLMKNEANQTLMAGEKDKSTESRNDMAAGSVEGIKTRTNFNETAFFYPHLRTNENGDIIIAFTMPEALTRWKFMGLATTADLKTGYTEKEIVTQKDLMVMTNPPRFFREGDEITFSAKVTNLTKDSLCGEARLFLFDALTGNPIDAQMKHQDIMKILDLPAGQSAEVSWDLYVPQGIQAITYKIYASSGKFSDAEEMIIPVLSNRMLVTETMPLPVRGKTEKTFEFGKLLNAGQSATLTSFKYTLEFTSNPAWYAVQALPYLMEYPYECAEQTFSRFYANSIATFIANSHPRIKAVFDAWRNETPDALLSNLEKNQELKSAILAETPWVLQAKDESQRKRNVGLLFDMMKMSGEIDQALRKLERLQCSNGGWPWFAGMPDDRYITQHIVTGMAHLDKLGVKNVREDSKAWSALRSGITYLDQRIQEDYEYILKYFPDHINDNHLSGIQIQYLYARSYYMKRIPLAARHQKAFDYFKGQAVRYWLQQNRYLQGMIALALNRLGATVDAANIIRSLKDNAMFSEELGMYWKDVNHGYHWYQAPIETQALLIEAFDEVANDQASVEEMKVWLLKQKQTQDWKTTKATTEACYALLLRGTDWLAAEPDISIFVGGRDVSPSALPDVKTEAGTGYYKTSWNAPEITPEMGRVKVVKRDDGVAWGAVYWQYFEQLDKITPAETPLKLNKQLFVERTSATGPVMEPITDATTVKVGDKIKVRVELRVDRDMEYVHMKDMRASGFEPINVISQYKYQGGLGYYEATGDAATNFFFSYLPKGTWVFEYPLRVAHKGNFSNGITSIQCMYAPEFASHSEGIRVVVR